MIRPDEYLQVERHAGDQRAGPGRRQRSAPTAAAAQPSMALPRNCLETDIRVR
jgi:hypothetical protein